MSTPTIASYDIAHYKRVLKAFELLKEARVLIERAHKGYLKTGHTLCMWIQEYQDAGFDDPECERYEFLDFEQVKRREDAIKNIVLAFGWHWEKKHKP